MSENDFRSLCDEKRILEFIYDDVDDSEIFASEPLTCEKDQPTERDTAQNSEIVEENETLKETLKKLQCEKEILELRFSELYKTAKAELDRKDKRLKDLEKEKDNILFRRGNNVLRNRPLTIRK